ncbi:hypothetical protein CBW16_02170 [Flavobacteriaceae bacterium JJC]|nr:hypothetical protein CBW16_02170 [Flavobacteriaceae bacterium JJC]
MGNDWERLNFESKVKEATITERFYSKSDSTRQYKRITYYSFDKNGGLIKTTNFTSNFGNPPIQRNWKEITRNNKGYSLKIETSDSGTSYFTYPKDSVVIITKKVGSDTVNISKYIEKKNIETLYQGTRGRKGSETTFGIYEYDKRNRILNSYDKITTHGIEPEIIKIKSTYTQKCVEFETEDFGNLHTKNTFDKNCNVIKRVQTFKNKPSAKYVYEFTYQYDKKGNWTERTTFLNSKKYSLTTRQINYY